MREKPKMNEVERRTSRGRIDVYTIEKSNEGGNDKR